MTSISTWQAPLADQRRSDEMLVAFDDRREFRVLVLPAWFDEANKLRRFTLDTMRALDARGIDTFLPDLPGCNDSLAPLDQQTLGSWREAAREAARHVGATHVLAIRAGALIVPEGMAGWLYAPQTGPKQLRGMIRARTIAAREAGREESSDALSSQGRAEGLELGGWMLGAAMFAEIEQAALPDGDALTVIAQKELGGGGLWLRAEPDADPAQAQALAGIVADSVA